MPAEAQLAHRVVRDTNVPYISNQSPIVTEPCMVTGSQDILTSINGYAERRPGFANTVETVPTAFHNLQRLFTWDDFNGNFFVMFCDINASGFSQVFKMQVGVDPSAVSIYTDTSAVPFDFVTSNGTVYFGNGVTMKKWNIQIGLENWGIAIGSIGSATGPDTAGAGATDGGFGTAWVNPGNVASSSLFATATLTAGSGGGANSQSQGLNATTFGFSIGSTSTILGISISFGLKQNVAYPLNAVFVQLLKGGVLVGTAKSTISSTTLTTVTMGGTSDLWGSSWSYNDINQTGFGFKIIVAQNGPNTTTIYSVNNCQVTIYNTGGPAIVVSASSGTMSATVGYEYVFTYGNSMTGHISSPTPASVSTGVFTNKLNVQVSLTASTDPQVNQIHVYRTTDSAATGTTGGTFFELPTSPYSNTTANILDSAADTSLNLFSLAPVPSFNDPPPASQGFVYFSGRIWMFVKNKVWFTGLEEIINGVPEESVPSGVAGNFWTFDENVQGLGVAGSGNNQTLGILCGGRLYGIQGNSLDTFRRFSISNRRGCRNRTTISMLGGMMGWLDSSSQIWATDGNSLQETSIPIRPDLASVNQQSCSMTFHTQGRFHWQVFSTGSKLLVYDMDTEQWMPPWSFSCQYIYSGETSPGNYQLMASTGTKAISLSTTAFNDNGTTYSPIIRTNLFGIVPDFGRRFSYVAAGMYDEPSRTGQTWYTQVDTNNVALADVLYIVDDDPTLGSFTSLTKDITSVERAFNRRNGTNVSQHVYASVKPTGRWYGLQINLVNADQHDNVYGWFIAYKAVR